MKNKLTIKQYAEIEGVKTSAIYNRIERGTLKSIKLDGEQRYVYPSTDKTIKKPRS